MIKSKIQDHMINDYAQWLKSETPRYRCLLERLLSYSDFFDHENTIEVRIPEDTFNSTVFLPHDRIPADYKNFHTNPCQLNDLDIPQD